MSARKAARYVTVAGRTYAPGEKIPAEVVELIDNPAVWESDEEPEDDEEPEGLPPMSGKGSGRDAWAAYAQANGVAVDDDATRDQIVAGLEAAGVATE